MGTPPSPSYRRVARNAIIVLLGNGWAAILALLLLPVLLHGLGPSAFGTWVLLQTFSARSGWLSLADIGLAAATTRAVASYMSIGDRRGADRSVSSAVAMFLALGAVGGGAFVVLGDTLLPAAFGIKGQLAPQFRAALVPFGVQIFLDLLSSAFQAGLEGQQRVDQARLGDAIRRTAVALATGAAATASGHIETVAFASMVASAVGTGVSLALLARVTHGWAPPRSTDAYKLLSYGLRVGLLDATGVFHRTMDRTVVGILLGPAAVTLVEIATQIQNGASAVLNATAYSVIPAAAWLKARGEVRASRLLILRGTKYSVLATLAPTLGAIVLAAPLVRVWLGPRYDAASGLVALALVYILLAAPLAVGSNYLEGSGGAGTLARLATLSLIVNLISSVVLVLLIGIPGVFIGTIIGTVVRFTPLLSEIIKPIGIRKREFFHGALLPTMLPSAALLLATVSVVSLPLPDQTRLVLGVFFGGFAYLVIALRFSLNRLELTQIGAVLRRR